MDITCPQCKTEYEFDDAKLTEAGVTVKCTSCNFMFKVRRKAVVEMEPVLPAVGAPLEAGSPSGKPWMIRTASGQMLYFQELTTLQKWIVERKVERDDHISKSGETWKRLGDIAELASFFQVVDAAAAAQSFAGPEPRRTTQPMAGFAAGQRSADPQEPDAIGTLPPEAEEPAFASASAPAFQAVGPSAAWEEGGGRFSARHSLVDPGDEEIPRRHTVRALVLVSAAAVLVIGGVLAFVYRDRLQALLGGGAAVGGAQVCQAGRKLFWQGDEESLRQADLELARAGAGDALAEAGRAEVLVTWANHLRDEAELLERQARALERAPTAGLDPRALRLKASTLREDSEHKLAQAAVHAKRAVDLSPDRGEVQRAMADYRRTARASAVELQPLLSDLRARLPEDPEAIFVEGAALAGQGMTARAESLLKEALTRTRARYGQLLVRAAFFLGMLQLRADRRQEARAQAQAILDVNPRHRWASLLVEVVRLEEQAPVARGTASPDLRAVAAPTPPTPAPGTGTPAPGTGTPAPGTGTSAPGGREPPANASYEQLVQQGAALSEKGRTMQAFKLFERALKMRPAGVEALVGIGFCHLDQERFAAAISYFKRALAISPTHGEALIGMGEAYKVQGTYNRALDYYRAYLNAHPGGPKSVLARTNVADLERKVSPAPSPSPSPETPAPEPAPTPPATPPEASP